MRLLLLAVSLFIGLACADSVEECTRDERQEAFANKVFNDPVNYNFTKICPTLFLNSSENPNIQEFDDIFKPEDVSWLVKKGSCTDQTCFSYLRDLTTSMPNCYSGDINYKFIFAFDFVICARIVSSGSVTMREIKQFYDDMERNLTAAVDAAIANLSSTDSATITKPADGSVPTPSSATGSSTAVAASTATAVVTCALLFS